MLAVQLHKSTPLKIPPCCNEYGCYCESEIHLDHDRVTSGAFLPISLGGICAACGCFSVVAMPICYVKPDDCVSNVKDTNGKALSDWAAMRAGVFKASTYFEIGIAKSLRLNRKALIGVSFKRHGLEVFHFSFNHRITTTAIS